MKKQTKKLTLAKTTVRALSEGQLAVVAAAGSAGLDTGCRGCQETGNICSA